MVVVAWTVATAVAIVEGKTERLVRVFSCWLLTKLRIVPNLWK